MEPHRSNPGERGTTWFGGDAQYPDPNAYPRHGAAPPDRGGQHPWPPEQSPVPHPGLATEPPRVTGPAGAAAHSESSRRRPVTGLVIWLVAAVLALPVLRILADSVIGEVRSASGTISSVLVLLGLPIGAIGLHGLATGAARITRAPAYIAWLRPPVAYVPIALMLFIAAGLAAR